MGPPPPPPPTGSSGGTARAASRPESAAERIGRIVVRDERRVAEARGARPGASTAEVRAVNAAHVAEAMRLGEARERQREGGLASRPQVGANPPLPSCSIATLTAGPETSVRPAITFLQEDVCSMEEGGSDPPTGIATSPPTVEQASAEGPVRDAVGVMNAARDLLRGIRETVDDPALQRQLQAEVAAFLRHHRPRPASGGNSGDVPP